MVAGRTGFGEWPPALHSVGNRDKMTRCSGLFSGGFGGFCGLGFLVILNSLFDILPAALGLAVAGANADLAPKRLERETAFTDRRHDGGGGDAPADAHLLEVVDQVFLRIQKNNSLRSFFRMRSLPFTINDTL